MLHLEMLKSFQCPVTVLPTGAFLPEEAPLSKDVPDVL
jgi:hypothetical protein